MFSFIHYTSLDSWPAYKLLRIDQSNMCSHTHNYLMNMTQLWQRDWHLRMSGEARKLEEPVACILCLIVRSSRKHYLLLKKELAVVNCWVKLLQQNQKSSGIQIMITCLLLFMNRINWSLNNHFRCVSFLDANLEGRLTHTHHIPEHLGNC